MSMKDYEFMLESAKEHLVEINSLHRECVKNNYASPKFTNKIRYLLNDIESSLDYISFEIFTVYCLPEILEKENDLDKIEKHKRRVNFPLFHQKPRFDKSMRNMFPGLDLKLPAVIEVFEKYQPYNAGKDHWLLIFNSLVNSNKHRRLSKQRMTENIHNGYLEDFNGNKITIDSMIGGETAIVINGKAVDLNQPSNHPGIKKFRGDVTSEFVFSDSNQPVLSILREIISGTSILIDDLKGVLERF